MPSRILREGILESQRVDALSESEEIFYRRLMSIVDDYGRYEAHPALLRGRLYPLKLDTKTDKDVADMLNAVSNQRLAFVYRAGGKIYLQLLDFRQQTRSVSRYPEPDAKQLKSFAQQMPSKRVANGKKAVCAADAKHPCTDVHLGVFVFGVVVVCEGEAVIGDVVVDGPTGTTTFSPEKKPKGIEPVIKFGRSLSLSSAEARKFFEYNQSLGWGTGGLGWQDLMARWKQRVDAKSAAKAAVSKNSSGGSEVPFDSTKPFAHTGGLELL